MGGGVEKRSDLWVSVGWKIAFLGSAGRAGRTSSGRTLMWETI